MADQAKGSQIVEAVLPVVEDAGAVLAAAGVVRGVSLVLYERASFARPFFFLRDASGSPATYSAC